MQKDITKYFSTGLESDLAEHLIPPTSYISGYNLRTNTTDNGQVGFIENILQTAEKNHTLPAGTNNRIGFCSDDENGFIVKANCNSNGDHGIYLYDINTNTWYTVLEDSDVTGGLNFDKYELINGMYIIGRQLFFNDGQENHQRCLNLSAFTDAYGSSPFSEIDFTITLPIDASEITLIKKPHPYPPITDKQYDSGFANNFIQNESFQFSVEYEHFDGMIAVLSDWSRGSLLNKPGENFNFIRISFDSTEEVPQTVRLVSYIMRQSGIEGGKRIKTWDRNISSENTDINNLNLTFDYYGNITGEQVDNVHLTRPFHSVPISSVTMEKSKNTTILGGNLEGYNTPPSTSLSLSLPSAVSLGFSTLNKPLYLVKHRNGRAGAEAYAYVGWYVFLTEVVPVGFYLVNSLEAIDTSSGTYPATPATPTTCAFSALTFRGADINTVIVNTKDPASNRWDNETTLTVNNCSITSISVTSYSMFLPKSQRKGGVTFYDKYLRKCGTVYNDDIITVPGRNYAFSSGYASIEWALSNAAAITEIPDWGWYYSVDLTLDQRTRYFVASYAGTDCKYATRDSNGLFVYTATTFASNVVAIAIKGDALLQANLGWVYNDGDQCILIDNSNNTYELPVIGQEDGYFLLKPQDIGTLSSKTFVFELYVPYKSSQQEPFFGMGRIYKINSPGTGSREYSTLAGSFRPETVVLSRTFNATSYFAEAMCPNDIYFQRRDNDTGRPNYITKQGQVYKPTGISWSNTYIPGTQNNGLGVFDALDKKILPEDIGEIEKIIQVLRVQEGGSFILCLGNSETISIYLGEKRIFDNEGNSFLASTSEFIGQVNPLRGGFGCQNHESVVTHDGLAWWYNRDRSAFVRYDNNGLDDISELGLKRVTNLFSLKYASLTIGQIEALGSRPFVFGGIDPYHKEVLWTIPSTESTPPKGNLPDYSSPNRPYPYDVYDGVGKTLVFSLVNNKWAFPHKYESDGFVSIRNKLFSSKNGQLYQHNDTGGRSNFYGADVIPAIGFIFNEEPENIKQYLTLLVQGNFKPTFTHMRTELPNVQSTDLVSEWVTREGNFDVAILRDRLSPNTTGTYEEKLFKGDKMIGQWMKCWMEFDVGDSLLQIRFLGSGYQDSLGQKQK